MSSAVLWKHFFEQVDFLPLQFHRLVLDAESGVQRAAEFPDNPLKIFEIVIERLQNIYLTNKIVRTCQELVTRRASI